MIQAIRVTKENFGRLQQIDLSSPFASFIKFGRLQQVDLPSPITVGSLIVFRRYDVVMMDPDDFDYQYEFVYQEDPTWITEVRVKDTPEARAELALKGNIEELSAAIREVLDANPLLNEAPYRSLADVLVDRVITEGWQK